MRWRIEFTLPTQPNLGAAVTIAGHPDNVSLSEEITRWAHSYLGKQLPNVAVRLNDEETKAEIYASAEDLPIGNNGDIPEGLRVGSATIAEQPTEETDHGLRP